MEPENGDDIGNAFLQESYIVPDEMDCLELDTSDDSCTDGLKPCSPLREQDRFLPIANVAKIMKKAIPNNGKIAKDSRECVQECVSEFISFITSEASERCHTEKRKTINGEDILFAMTALGFENYVEPLKLYLNKYRETTKSDKTILTNDCVFEAITEDYKPTIETPTLKTEPHGTTVLYLQNDQIQPFQL